MPGRCSYVLPVAGAVVVEAAAVVVEAAARGLAASVVVAGGSASPSVLGSASQESLKRFESCCSFERSSSRMLAVAL